MVPLENIIILQLKESEFLNDLNEAWLELSNAVTKIRNK